MIRNVDPQKATYLGIIHSISLGKPQTGHILKSFFGCERKWICLESNTVGLQGKADHKSSENVDEVLDMIFKTCYGRR